MGLIAELEGQRIREFEQSVQAMEAELLQMSTPCDPTEAIRGFISTGDRGRLLRAVFAQPYLKQVPEAIKVRLCDEIPGVSDDDGWKLLKRLPLNRARRRALHGSRQWVVFLCSGAPSEGDPLRVWCQERNLEYLEVDIMCRGGRGWDLCTESGVWSVLLWAAAQGRVASVLSSPPHRTWSSTEGAPNGRSLQDPWAAHSNDGVVFKESMLAVQDMVLWSISSVARGYAIPFLKEIISTSSVPHQGQAVKMNPEVFWETDAWKTFQHWAKVKSLTFCQGSLGHDWLCPTVIGTNLGLDHLHGLPKRGLPSPLSSEGGTAFYSQWSKGFKKEVVEALAGKVKGQTLDELDQIISNAKRNLATKMPSDDDHTSSEPSDAGTEPTSGGAAPDLQEHQEVEVHALKPSEAEEWRAHIMRGHVPYRRDCRYCVEGSGLGIQHRKVKHPQAYTLSVDLFGPTTPAEKGRDEQSVSGKPHLRYGLVGVYRLPKSVLANKLEPPEKRTNEAQEQAAPIEDFAEYEPSEPGLDLEEALELGMPEMPEPYDRPFGGSVKSLGLDEDSTLVDQEDEYDWIDDEQLQTEVADLTSKVEMVTLRYIVGLKSKTGADVTAGIQQLVLKITQSYPVRVLHCDPGTEFTSDALARWLPDKGVRMQTTVPTDKQGNGLAERVVGWFKARARTLLGAAGLSATYWPLAMRWAAEAHNRSVTGQPPLPAFGQPVLHKLKKPAGGHKEILSRWIRASYATPHLTISDGHVLVTAEGNLVASRGFRAGCIDTKALEEAQMPVLQEEEEPEELPPPIPDEDDLGEEPLPSAPGHRLREKTTVRFLEAGLDPTSPETIAQTLLLDEDLTDSGFRRVVSALEGAEATSKDRRGDFEGRFVLGAYCHGGQRGVTTLCKNHPRLTQFLNKFLKSRMSSSMIGVEWSSLLLMHASDVPTHRDFRNEWGTDNYVLCIPGTVDLWVGPQPEKRDKTPPSSPVWSSSNVHCVTGKVKAFNPRCYHAVRKNPDWVLVGYSPLGVRKLCDEDQHLLRSLGFGPPCKLEEEYQVKVVRQEQDPERSPEQPSASGSQDQGPLSQDEQADSNTMLVGWDLSESAQRNQPTGDSLPRDLQLFLWERDIVYLLPELQHLGIEEPEDLIYIFEEDLIEFGLTRDQAARVLFGVHPPGTRRPDNPNNCGLKTGEVRLFDRDSQQIPWVMQNRTLSQSSPGPPLPNLGVRTGGAEPSSSSQRWHDVDQADRASVDQYEDEIMRAQPASLELPSASDSPSWDVSSYEPPPWEVSSAAAQPAAYEPPPWEIPSAAAPPTAFRPGEEPAPEPAAHYWEDEWTPSNMPAGYGCGLWQDSWQPEVHGKDFDTWDDSWVSHTAAASSSDHVLSEEAEGTPTMPTAQEISSGVPDDGNTVDPVIGHASTETPASDDSGGASIPYPPGLGFSDDSTPSVCMVRTNGFPNQLGTARALITSGEAEPRSCQLPSPQVCASTESLPQIGVHFPSVVTAEVKDGLETAGDLRVAKVVENSYTPNIEELLGALNGPLEVVHQVAPADVRSHLDKWKDAAQDELDSLVKMQAIKRYRGSEVQKLLRDPNLEVLPAKCVFTVKPGKPYRRKVRIVSCGNYAQGVSEDVLYASGAAAETLRAVLVRSGQRRYSAWATDIKNAFLLAPIPATAKKRYALRPPAILVQLGIVEQGEVWEVCKALYGFKEAPKWWSQYRDQVLSTTHFQVPSGFARLKRIVSDENLWVICLEDSTVLGYVLVYVDDLLILSNSQVSRSLHEWIRERWQCSELEKANPTKALRFLGIDVFEVQDDQGPRGFALGQEGYIDELIRSHDLSVTCKASTPVPKEWVREAPPEEPQHTEAELREAQRITGELLWVSQRTRVDISFSVGLMSSWVSRSPTYVSKIGLRILAYLANTKGVRLCLVPQVTPGLEVFTDASFAPFSDRLISGIIVQLAGRCVFWKSRRQSIVSLSTAECELIAACEGVVLAQSMQALASELLDMQPELILQVDNVAAITLAEGGGSQRTRHLRVRANFLKEMIENSQLTVKHCPGERQLADILTKALPVPRLGLLNQLLGITAESLSDPLVLTVATTSRAFRTLEPTEGQGMTLILALLMLQMQPVTSQDDEDREPVDLDLYLVAVMMACSILFVWEVGKHCFRQCARETEARVSSVQPSSNDTRRTRRQQAVRRALERETQVSSDQDTRGAAEESSVSVPGPNSSSSSHVHVHMTTPSTPLRTSEPSAPPTWTLVRPPTPPIPEPPPPPPVEEESKSKGRSVSSRDVGVQTVGPTGLSDAQLCEIELITSSARTPGVIHIFPNCHVLRTVQGTHRRTFCRYCLWTLRQQGYQG